MEGDSDYKMSDEEQKEELLCTEAENSEQGELSECNLPSDQSKSEDEKKEKDLLVEVIGATDSEHPQQRPAVKKRKYSTQWEGELMPEQLPWQQDVVQQQGEDGQTTPMQSSFGENVETELEPNLCLSSVGEGATVKETEDDRAIAKNKNKNDGKALSVLRCVHKDDETKICLGAYPKKRQTLKEEKEKTEGASVPPVNEDIAFAGTSSACLKPWCCTMCKFINPGTMLACNTCGSLRYIEENLTTFTEMFLTGKRQRKLACFVMFVAEPAEITIMLKQISEHALENVLLDLGVIILMKRNNDYRALTDKSKRNINQKELRFSARYDEGEYLIVPVSFGRWNVDNITDEQLRYTLEVKSTSDVLIIKEEEEWNLADIIILLTLTGGEPKVLDKDVTLYIAADKSVGCMAVAENNNLDCWAKVGVTFGNKVGTTSTRGIFQYEDILPPFHRQVVAVITSTISYEKIDSQCAALGMLMDDSSVDENVELHSPPLHPRDNLHIPQMIQSVPIL